MSLLKSLAMGSSLAQLARATLRAHARASCPSCCSACAAHASLMIPAQPCQIQISPDHCLLERKGQVHVYWKCWCKIDYDSRESKSGLPYLSYIFVILSLSPIRCLQKGHQRTVTKVLPEVLCSVMLPKHLCWTCRPLPGNASSGHLRTSDRDCQKQRHP